MATHSSILAWEIQWTEEFGRLQSMGSQRVRHHVGTKTNKQNQSFPTASATEPPASWAQRETTGTALRGISTKAGSSRNPHRTVPATCLSASWRQVPPTPPTTLLARCPPQPRYRFSEYGEARKRSSGPHRPRPAHTPRPPGHLPPTTGVRERAGRPRSPRGLSLQHLPAAEPPPSQVEERPDLSKERASRKGKKKKQSSGTAGPESLRGRGVGAEVVQATADPFPAPGSPGLRGLFGQKRKRGFSKVEEEPKKAEESGTDV